MKSHIIINVIRAARYMYIYNQNSMGFNIQLCLAKLIGNSRKRTIIGAQRYSNQIIFTRNTRSIAKKIIYKCLRI